MRTRPNPASIVSVLVLVASNLIPVYGVLALGWDVFPIVLLFWLENVVIGLLNVLRMVTAQPAEGPMWAAKLFMVPFFTVHYGIFTLVHGVFVLVLFSGGGVEHVGGPHELAGAVREAVASRHLGWPLLALAASHFVSFVGHWLLDGEFRTTPLMKVMMQPYGRIIVLHVTILLGGFLVMSLGSPVWALLLLIVLKIGFDLRAHLRAHEARSEGDGA